MPTPTQPPLAGLVWLLVWRFTPSFKQIDHNCFVEAHTTLRVSVRPACPQHLDTLHRGQSYMAQVAAPEVPVQNTEVKAEQTDKEALAGKVAKLVDDHAAELGEATAFQCNICYELAKEPVVTLCGHLYCWPCVYRCEG